MPMLSTCLRGRASPALPSTWLRPLDLGARRAARRVGAAPGGPADGPPGPGRAVRRQRTWVTRVRGALDFPAPARRSERGPTRDALAAGNRLSVVVDGLLVGNNPRVAMPRHRPTTTRRAAIGSGRPGGGDPDDVARCAVADDALGRSCDIRTTAARLCICRRAGGCTCFGGPVAQGEPVGVLDVNQDGAADDTRFIAARRASSAARSRSIDPDRGLLEPLGDQSGPALGGLDALGPPIVLDFRTGTPARRGLTFSEAVVDKQGDRLRAGGRPARGGLRAGRSPRRLVRAEPLAITDAASPIVQAAPDGQARVRLHTPIAAATPTASSVDAQRRRRRRCGPSTCTGITLDSSGAAAPPGPSIRSRCRTRSSSTFAQPLPKACSAIASRTAIVSSVGRSEDQAVHRRAVARSPRCPRRG